MSESKDCRHRDIRIFDGIRCCLSCGMAIFDWPPAKEEDFRGDDFREDASGLNKPQEYQYKNLNFDLGQEVRLIVLWPGLPSDPLQCEIIHRNLERNLLFEAVSYTWATEDGDDSLSERVYCPGGTIIKITANCAAALRQIRLTSGQRRVWVDAICIHQDNLKERNHQVSLMDQIYSQVSAVLVCINDPSNDYSEVCSYLKGNDPENEIQEESCSNQMFLLKHLRWFSRLWVVQEVALARVTFMHVNNQIILLTPEVIRRFGLLDISGSREIPGPLRCTLLANGGSDFLTCLIATKTCESTDPRDKVFGILSLVDPKFRRLVTVDYEASLAQIYIQAAACAIVQRRDLEVLRYIEYEYKEWPSWVPKWYKSGWSFGRQLEGDAVGPWRSSTSEETLRISWPNGRDCIGMPQLQVRAHFVDSISFAPISTTFGSGSQFLGHLVPIKKILDIVDREQSLSQSGLHEHSDNEGVVIASDETIVPCRNGYVYVAPLKRKQLIAGDAIYAIDGSRSLFVLRNWTAGAFKIVGTCHLQTAFPFMGILQENPSSRSPNLDRDSRDGWSGMIEIC